MKLGRATSSRGRCRFSGTVQRASQRRARGRRHEAGAYCGRMSSKRGPARETARWWAHDEVWLDHTVLSAGDAEWLAPARKPRMSAVKAPDGLLAQLPHLEWLILRGGRGTDVRVADGCSGLRYLSVDQIRGCTDLSVLPALTQLELLSLYGLPRVSR